MYYDVERKFKFIVAKDLKKRTMFYFTHAHSCSKFKMRHKATVVIVLKFVAKGNRNNKYKYLFSVYTIISMFVDTLQCSASGQQNHHELPHLKNSATIPFVFLFKNYHNTVLIVMIVIK
jgi:hypothetical protein